MAEDDEIEQLHAELAEARQQLDAIHGSRLWRTANVYWSLRRRIAALLRPAPRRPAPPRPADAGPPPAARPTPKPAPRPPEPRPSSPATANSLRHGRQFRGMQSIDGRCNVCGEATSFYFSDSGLFRESLTCGVCHTTSRYRSIALGLLRAADLLADVRVESLAALAAARSPRRISVYDTQAPFSFRNHAYPIPELLARAEWIDVTTSRYDPDERAGAKLGGRTTNQNLEKLTFPDASFDVVVTSDVLEHVRRDDLAFAEIRRVLRPGGIFLFTVPHYRDRETLVRVRITDPGDPSRDEYLLEPEYHIETSSGEGRSLAYRAYGTDLDDRLHALGFDVDYSADPVDELGIRDTELFFCRRVT